MCARAQTTLVLVALLAPGVARAEKACLVEGRAVDPFGVETRPKGGQPMKLWIRDVAATVHPPVKSGPARVEVRGALAFEATAPFDKIPYKTRRLVEAASGMVRIAPGTEGLAVRTSGKWADADLTIGQVTLRGLLLPCDALTLDPVPRPELEPNTPDEEALAPTAKILHLRSGPGAGLTLEVEIGGDDLTVLDLHKTERHGPWMRVSSHWIDGTTLAGWVKQTDVKKPDPHQALAGVAGVLPAIVECKRAPAAPPGARLVSAPVAHNVAVLADRLFPWATVRGGEPLTVLLRPKDSWAEIVSVPGIASATECAEHSTVLEDAWIPTSAVQLPGSPDGGAAPVEASPKPK